MYDLIILVGLLALAYAIGSLLEARHYRAIRRRETELRELTTIASKTLPADLPPSTTTLVAGSVVISVDAFKRFIAWLRNMVGGRVSSYESLIDRAR
ncbi:MAG: heavy metal-binding domain-containing protein, partial [Woeseiaceae bacterium]